MLSKKKKVIILCSMVVLLVATGFLNVFLNKGPAGPVDGGNVAAGDFFATYRADRLATRNTSIKYLDDIINATGATEQAIADAQAKKLELVTTMEKELVLEGLIKAQGYEDCIVTLSTENVNLIIKHDELKEEDVARILSTLVNETKKDATNIKIIPVE